MRERMDPYRLDELEGRVLALESEVKRLERRDTQHLEIFAAMRREVLDELRSVKARFDSLTDWTETTEVRTRRKNEHDRMVQRANEADTLEERLHRTKRIAPVVSMALAALLYALARLVESFALHH